MVILGKPYSTYPAVVEQLEKSGFHIIPLLPLLRWDGIDDVIGMGAQRA